MRRSTSLLLAVVTLLGLAAAPAAARTSGTFADDDRSVHERSIEALYEARITTGCGLGRFCPDEPVTRGQLAAFLNRTFRPGPATRDWFRDDDGSTFEGDINRVRAAGWADGCAADRFCPDRPVTRAQLAKLVGNALGLAPDTSNHFTDDDGHPLERHVDALRSAGLTTGCNPPASTAYCPDRPVTRGQLATFLTRALGLTTATPSDVTHPVGLRWNGLELRLPSAATELVGLHESSHDGARNLDLVGVEGVVMDSRRRGTGARSAADIVTHPGVEIRSPVTGTVKRAGTYRLYCRYADAYLVVEPDGRPGIEVKLLHIDGVLVRAGDRVTAGVTVVSRGPTQLPFTSQVDEHSAASRPPHVHLEVVDTAIPDRRSGGGGC